MQNMTKLPFNAWVSLLWSKYNKLSEPLKEVFINLANNMAKETVNKSINSETDVLTESNMFVQKVSETHK
jgi:hypothetical protein